MKYYWLIIILLFGAKLLKGKELSSYNIKWMLTYIIYLLWLQVIYFVYIDWEEEADYYLMMAFILPLILYLIFPFVWKFLSGWKMFKWIESKIDMWYNTIRNLS